MAEHVSAVLLEQLTSHVATAVLERIEEEFQKSVVPAVIELLGDNLNTWYSEILEKVKNEFKEERLSQDFLKISSWMAGELVARMKVEIEKTQKKVKDLF